MLCLCNLLLSMLPEKKGKEQDYVKIHFLILKWYGKFRYVNFYLILLLAHHILYLQTLCNFVSTVSQSLLSFPETEDIALLSYSSFFLELENDDLTAPFKHGWRWKSCRERNAEMFTKCQSDQSEIGWTSYMILDAKRCRSDQVAQCADALNKAVCSLHCTEPLVW